MSDEGLIQTKPGQAHSEDGLVVLDGPDGIAVTMTAEAARGTAASLKSAADEVLGEEVSPSAPINDLES
ncbi:MAG: hypothetical protein DI606_19860 [Sphingobium sp.]|uniref:hypothetical protein n=1 Tax=Sphingobium sp. TaxID=1912891 RepID=UPI000DB16006|nr:hypothetical protein [Sphingobium sp.]PZU05386.1 MAG: hypothetical protein DI606_19860 [Sphingobium sp.]PZU67055.1 MAG: hypothetical protein DI546_22270 [Rhizobium sp.]